MVDEATCVAARDDDGRWPHGAVRFQKLLAPSPVRRARRGLGHRAKRRSKCRQGVKYRPPLGPRQTSDRPLAVQIWRDSHGQGLGHRLAAPGELGGAVLEAGWWQRDAAAVPGLSADSAGRRRGRPRRFIVREELARSSAGLGSGKEMAAGLGVCGADRRRRRPYVPVDGRVQPSCIAHELILDVEAGGE